MQQFLKAFIRSTRARIIPPELFRQFLVAVNDAHAALDMRLRREPATPFTGALESKADRDTLRNPDAWDTS
jgi:hypothetical protein